MDPHVRGSSLRTELNNLNVTSTNPKPGTYQDLPSIRVEVLLKCVWLIGSAETETLQQTEPVRLIFYQ